MAENRGGMRPTAPQNNPANVSATGGAGQSGNYTGFAYGMNKTLNESRVEGNQAMRAANPAPAPMLGGMSVTPITEGTQRPEENVLSGLTPYGQQNDPNALGIPAETDNAQFNSSIDSYYPVISWIQSQPRTSKETRSVLAMLMRGRGE